MKSMLQNDPDRMAMVSGGNGEPVPEIMQRINAIINDEVKFAKEYGDEYFNSGVGLFGRLERSLGDSGEGQRAFDAIKKEVNNDKNVDFSDIEIRDMLNKGYMDADLPYRFELPKELMEMEQRDSKAEGGSLKNPEKADLDKDGKISDYEQARGEAIEESMEEREKFVLGAIAGKLSQAVSKIFSKSTTKQAAKQEQELKKLIDEYVDRQYEYEDMFQDAGVAGMTPEEILEYQGAPIALKIADLLNKADNIFDSNLENAAGYTRYDYVDDILKDKGAQTIFDESRGGILTKNAEKYDGLNFRLLLAERDAEDKGAENIIENIKRNKKEKGGVMDEDEQMKMLMEEQQVPDEEMEEDYLDFIINEALNPEEEDFLVEQLKDNDKLSEIFDKVIEVASEFTGAGPVEGPGTGVSDSIPARLSDGEFVFTAKATEQIGVDKLMSMMKEAEAAADKRRGMQEGGVLSETTTTTRRFTDPTQMADEEEVMKDEKTIQDMRATNPRMQ